MRSRRKIEEPFGTDDNDLALDAMSAFIEDAARDLLAQPSLDNTTAANASYQQT